MNEYYSLSALYLVPLMRLAGVISHSILEGDQLPPNLAGCQYGANDDDDDDDDKSGWKSWRGRLVLLMTTNHFD